MADETVRRHWNGTVCLIPEDCVEDWAEESDESAEAQS